MPDFNAVIVGSGFGGSVTACRLAEAGERVLVLERGREWKPQDYPSVSGQDLAFDVDDPQAKHGWLGPRYFDDMAVAQGAGVGGGSLIYANVSASPPITADVRSERFAALGRRSQLTALDKRPDHRPLTPSGRPPAVKPTAACTNHPHPRARAAFLQCPPPRRAGSQGGVVQRGRILHQQHRPVQPATLQQRLPVRLQDVLCGHLAIVHETVGLACCWARPGKIAGSPITVWGI